MVSLEIFSPKNSVEYFVSYYDYYQPEAYVPASDTYIAKDASINEHIEQMRSYLPQKHLLKERIQLSLRPFLLYMDWVRLRSLFGNGDAFGSRR